MLVKIHSLKLPTTKAEFQQCAATLAGIFAIAIGLVLPFSTSLMEIFFYGAVILALASGVVGKNWRVIFQSHIGALLLLLYLFLALSIIYSTADLQHAIAGLFKYNKLLLGILLMPILVEKKWRDYALFALMVAIAVVALWSTAKSIHQWQASASAIDATVVKNYIAQSYCVAIGAYLFAQACFRYRRFCWLFLPLAIVALINVLLFNAGRSGYLVLGVLFVLFFWQHFGAKGALLGLFLLAFLFASAFMISPVFHARTAEVVQNYQQFNQGHVETSVGERMSFAFGALKIVQQHAIWGTGVGSFVKEFNKLNAGLPITTANPHNEYLNIAVQLGVLGVSLLLVLFIAGWWQAQKLPPYYRQLAQAIILVVGIGACVNSWLMDVTEGFMFVYLLAIAFSAFPRVVE